jgi:hydrogenase/urease accessory protein HupE
MGQVMRDMTGNHPYRFSLAVLFRAVTLTSLGLGWLLAVPWVPPRVFVAVIILLGMMLGGVASAQRDGTQGDRFKAWIGFLAGTVAVALYSGYVATVAQTPDDTGARWAGLGRLLNEVMILILTPVIVMILVFLLRAWTWSAHDSQSGDTFVN